MSRSGILATFMVLSLVIFLTGTAYFEAGKRGYLGKGAQGAAIALAKSNIDVPKVLRIVFFGLTALVLVAIFVREFVRIIFQTQQENDQEKLPLLKNEANIHNGF
ncbi:unnamed protein product [Caenorhabditis brenneri]